MTARAPSCEQQQGYGAQFIGNAWTIPSLQAIIALGMVLSLVPTVSLFFFDDDKTLGHESEALLESAEPGKASLTIAVPCHSQLNRHSGCDLLLDELRAWLMRCGSCSRQLSGVGAMQASSLMLPEQAGLTADEEDVLKEKASQQYRYGLKIKYIPFIVCISDTVVGLGSGALAAGCMLHRCWQLLLSLTSGSRAITRTSRSCDPVLELQAETTYSRINTASMLASRGPPMADCLVWRQAMNSSSCPSSSRAEPGVLLSGSGMTVKFMPVWFLDRVQLDPSALNLVMAALPAGIALLSVAAPYICRIIGTAARLANLQLLAGVTACALPAMLTLVLHHHAWPRLLLPGALLLQQACWPS